MRCLHRSSKKAIYMLALLIGLLLITLLSCGGGNGGDDLGFATWTPSPSATATCNPHMSLSTPSEWGTTHLVVILYDPRPQTVGDQYIELENKEKIRDVPSFIEKIVPRLIKPSGQVSIFQLGYSSYDSARVARLFSYAIVPQLYNTPSPLDTLTPLPPITLPPPGFERVATEQAIRIQSTAKAATESAREAVYSCEINYWNDVVRLTATAWNGIATAEISDAEDDFATEVANHNNGQNVIETPFRTDELYYGGVYHGLSFASRVFQAECKNYSKCTLIVIDDLRVYQEYNHDNLPINLTGVDVYAIMPNCKDLAQPSCTEVSDYWDPELKKYGAEEVFFWNGVRAETNLLNAIGR